MTFAPRYELVDVACATLNGVEIAIWIDQVPVAIPKVYFDLVFAPQPTPDPDRVETTATARKPGRKPKTVSAEKSAADLPADEDFGETKTTIFSLLARRPMTSAEIIEESKLAPTRVYTALSELRKSGRILTNPDDDGTRRNHLATRNA